MLIQQRQQASTVVLVQGLHILQQRKESDRSDSAHVQRSKSPNSRSLSFKAAVSHDDVAVDHHQVSLDCRALHRPTLTGC